MRDAIRIFVAFVAYWSGFDNLFYWLNRKAKKIVTFHNVLPDDLASTIPPVGVSMSVDSFVKIVDEVAAKFRISVDIEDPQSVTLTFDDGTLNEYEVAGKYLMNRGLPAILFVAQDFIDATPETIPVIEKICAWATFVPMSIAESLFGRVKSREELWIKFVQPGFKSDWKNKGLAFMKRLELAYPMAYIYRELPLEWLRLRMNGMSKLQLDELRAHGWKIGWHTKSHFPLGCLPTEEREKELKCPKEYNDTVLGYPYGDLESVGIDTLDIVREMGYPAAVSNCSCRLPNYGRYFMMRMAPSSSRYELHLMMSGLKYFLQTGKLLPKYG